MATEIEKATATNFADQLVNVALHLERTAQTLRRRSFEAEQMLDRDTYSNSPTRALRAPYTYIAGEAIADIGAMMGNIGLDTVLRFAEEADFQRRHASRVRDEEQAVEGQARPHPPGRG
jgi:hypothetical protein